MGFWDFILGRNNDPTTINPANGLPMIDRMGSLDVAGNVFGTNASSTSSHSDLSSSISNDSIFDSSSSWDSNSSFDTSSSFDSGSSFDSSSSWD